jgi:hypothetical protein
VRNDYPSHEGPEATEEGSGDVQGIGIGDIVMTDDSIATDVTETSQSTATAADPKIGKQRGSYPDGRETLEPGPAPAGQRRVEIDGESFAVVEGDLLLDQDQWEIYGLQQQMRAMQREIVAQSGLTDPAITPGGAGTSALIAIGQDGQIVRWAPGVVLTYCVLRQTFRTAQQYQVVVENVAQAAQAWMDTCGVEFQYVPDLDSSSSTRPDGVVFPVRYLDTNGAFIAAAFFPTDMKSRWRLVIDPSYFTTSFDRVGVLRHELGHSLGFRHEHIRSEAPAVCPDESTTGTIDVTDYDPQSVMHYFCGGVGSRTLDISNVDVTGSQLVYGPPLGDFVLLEP